MCMRAGREREYVCVCVRIKRREQISFSPFWKRITRDKRPCIIGGNSEFRSRRAGCLRGFSRAQSKGRTVRRTKAAASLFSPFQSVSSRTKSHESPAKLPSSTLLDRAESMPPYQKILAITSRGDETSY